MPANYQSNALYPWRVNVKRILKSVANNLGNYNDNCDIHYANTAQFVPFRYPFPLYSRKVP